MGVKERRSRERQQRELEIIDGAAQLFVEKGFAHTTMDDIVDQLELSKGGLYHHFKSKDELLYAAATRGLELFRKMILESMEGKESGLEKVTAIGQAYVGFYTSQPNYRKIFSELALASPPTGPRGIAFARSGEETNGLMVEAIKEGIRDGSIRQDINPQLLAFTASSAFEGVLSAVERRKPHGPGLRQEDILNFTFDIFRKAIAR